MTPSPRTRSDPRHYQILILSSLLAYGLIRLRFDVSAAQALLTLGSALAAQWACTRIWRLPRFDPKSALISGLGLCILLRADRLWLVPAIAAATIGSKFALRFRGKHVWNPTNFGLAFGMAALGGVWVSPGQWGSVAFFAFLMACLGGLVVNRAARSDVTIAFLASTVAILVARSLWLDEAMTIPLHRLQNGAFLVFAFFMISDPKTTPDRRAGRILFAALVALGAAYVTFVLNRTNGLIWSLAVLAPTVPLIDRILPGVRYVWSRAPFADSPKGAVHETLPRAALSPLLPRSGRVGGTRP
jgi:Na+-transporting NADH:ubiquinone oxidoreductase subunit NqrB